MPLPRTIEPDLRYCPQCGDEYRAEIATCAACRCGLVSGRRLLASTPAREEIGTPMEEIQPGDPLVTIRKGPVLPIRQLGEHLRRHGVASLAGTEGGTACATGCRGPEILLQVRERDLATAMIVLAQEYRQSTSLADHDLSLAGEVFDPDAGEATCPACGCHFATTLTACPDCGLCFA